MSRIAGFCLTVVTLAARGPAASAQNPLHDHTEGVEIRFARTQPVVGYTLRVDAGDLSGFDVELRLRNLRDTFRLAMVAHPEYDDRNWRFVEALRVETPNGAATVSREDSALWRVVAPGGEALVRYRMRLPAPESPRAAWRPFLAATGGLIGGPHAFLYVVGATLAPSHVTLELPPEWQIATGLEPTLDPHTFFAPTVGVLVDSPMLVGRLRSWRFAVDGVPHGVVYWPLPDAAPFDTEARGTPRVRLDARGAPGGAYRPLPRQPGQLHLLSRKRERGRVRRGSRLTRRLQRQHPLAGRAARRDARLDCAGRDERRSLDRRRHARDAGALRRGTGVHRSGHRTDDRRRMRVQCSRLLRDARARTAADRFRPVPATHWTAHPRLMDARAGPRWTARGRSTAVRMAAAGGEPAQPRDHQPGGGVGQGRPAHRRSPRRAERGGGRDGGGLPLDRDPPADWRHHRRRGPTADRCVADGDSGRRLRATGRAARGDPCRDRAAAPTAG